MPIIRNKDQSNKKKKLNPLKWSWTVEWADHTEVTVERN